MKENNIKFNLEPKSEEEEFNTEYRKIQQLGNTSIKLIKRFEDDNEFMQAFQNEFVITSLKPDVAKYWIGLFSEEKVNATILESNGIQSDVKGFPLESELYEKKIKFYELLNEEKEPKECYTHQIAETNIYQQFRNIENILNSFKEMKDFDNSSDSLLRQAEEFGKGLISEIQNVNYEPIRIKIIETIIKDKENINSLLNGLSDNHFNKKAFDDNYAKAKMYLNNYLETQKQKVETKELTKSKDISNCLEDFLINPSDKHKIPLIVEKFKNEKGKSMAIAIYLLRELDFFNYELNSRTKGRSNFAKLLNNNIKMNGVNMHFAPNTYDLQNSFDDDLKHTKQWLNGL